jgi:DNA-binding response OmpR family regulator
MPEMEGESVRACARCRTRANSRNFFHGQDSRENKVEGLTPAARTLSQAIDLDETLARVNTQLRIGETKKILELSPDGGRAAIRRRGASAGHRAN